MNSVGFDLNDAFFYVHSSNTPNVARFGGTLPSSTISLYSDNDPSKSYFLGVEQPDDPTFWIGKSNVTTNDISRLLYIKSSTGYIGIGTSQPSYSMDIHGDIRITGQLVQEGCNVIITTQTVQTTTSSTDFISSSSNVDAIDFSGSSIKNLMNARINSNLYVGETVSSSNITTQRILVQNPITTSPALIVRNTSYVPQVAEFYSGSNVGLIIAGGGSVGIRTASPTGALHVYGHFKVEEGVTIQQMGDMQRIQACTGQVNVTTIGEHEIGFTLVWSADANTEKEMMQADVTFFGCGNRTRTYMSFSQLINPVNDNFILPGSDITLDYKNVKHKKYPNIVYVKNAIERAGARSVKIKVKWLSNLAVDYNVNMKTDILMPKRLGFVSLTPFYI